MMLCFDSHVFGSVGVQVLRSFDMVDRSEAWFFRDYVDGILGYAPVVGFFQKLALWELVPIAVTAPCRSSFVDLCVSS